MNASLDWNQIDFWDGLARLVIEHPLVIDRPKGMPHPRFPEIIYPLDYGYLDGTTTPDGGGLDAFRGSLPEPAVNALILTVDLLKLDAEIKLLLGCTPQEQQVTLDFLNSGWMRAVILVRSEEEAASG